jgi:hypothetical protein
LIEVATTAVPEADFWCGPVLDAPLPAAVAVAATGEVLNYAADRRSGYADIQQLARRIDGALVPEGLFLFDLAASPPDPVEGRWHDEDGWAIHMTSRVVGEIVDRSVTIFRQTGADTYQRSDERHALRLFDPGRVLADLDEVGLHAEVVAPEAGNALVFLAQKTPWAGAAQPAPAHEN